VRRPGMNQCSCLLSGMLYTLPIEPLLQLMNCESSFVLSAYADDVVTVKEQNDVNLLMKTLNESEMV